MDPVLDIFDDDDDGLMHSAERQALRESGNDLYGGLYGMQDDDSSDYLGAYGGTYPRGYTLGVQGSRGAVNPPGFGVQPSVVLPPRQAPRLDRVHMKGHEDEYRHGVKYLNTAMERGKYRVTVGNRMKRRGMLLDTESIKKHFKSKDRAGMGKAPLGSAALTQGTSRDTRREWNNKGLIWVCADGPTGEPEFFTHVGKIQRFHHSTFFAGDQLIGAGEWIVEDGYLRKISANSGHYQPSIDFLQASVLHLSDAWHEDTVVLVWDTVSGSWEYVPVRDFARGAGGGRWKSNPNA